MSEPREVEAVVITDKDKPFNDLTRSEKKARLAVVLDRGLTADRLIVDLPTHLHGEWCPNDPMEIARLQGMGFSVDTEYAAKRAAHFGGASEAKVGDVVFMTCPKDVKVLIDEIRHEKFIEAHGKRKVGNRAVQREEAEAINAASLPLISESDESAANAEHLREALFPTK